MVSKHTETGMHIILNYGSVFSAVEGPDIFFYFVLHFCICFNIHFIMLP